MLVDRLLGDDALSGRTRGTAGSAAGAIMSTFSHSRKFSFYYENKLPIA
jgi:hypothetical protein